MTLWKPPNMSTHYTISPSDCEFIYIWVLWGFKVLHIWGHHGQLWLIGHHSGFYYLIYWNSGETL